MKNTIWVNGVFQGDAEFQDTPESRAIIKELVKFTDQLTGNQMTELEHSLRLVYRAGKKDGSYNPSLDEALNSGDGTYKP